MEKASEKYLEKKLREKVNMAGGLCPKVTCLWFTGMPDRIILLPGGRIYFCELKSTGKKPAPRQVIVHKFLRDLGFTVYVIADSQQLERMLTEILTEIISG